MVRSLPLTRPGAPRQRFPSAAKFPLVRADASCISLTAYKEEPITSSTFSSEGSLSVHRVIRHIRGCLAHLSSYVVVGSNAFARTISPSAPFLVFSFQVLGWSQAPVMKQKLTHTHA